MAKRKRKLKKEASLVIGGIVVFLIFVIVSIVIKKNLEVTMEKKISSPVITVNDNIVTLKDFSYYIIDNQVTRSLMLDYELCKRKNSLTRS